MITDHSRSNMSRRGFFAASASVAAAAWLTPRWAFAKEASLVEQMRDGAVKGKIEVEMIREDLHVIMNSGGNIAVLSGPNGNILVRRGPRGLEAAGVASPRQARRQARHASRQHALALRPLRRQRMAARIRRDHYRSRKHAETSEPGNARRRLEVHVPAFAQGRDPDGHREERSTRSKPTAPEVHVEYFGGPRHTDGDLFAFFPDADVLHTGDTFWNGH